MAHLTIEPYLQRLQNRVEKIEEIYHQIAIRNDRELLATIHVCYALITRILSLTKQDKQIAETVYRTIYGIVDHNRINFAKWCRLEQYEQEIYIQMVNYIRNHSNMDGHKLHTQRYLLLVMRGKMEHPLLVPYQELSDHQKFHDDTLIEHVYDVFDPGCVSSIPAQRGMNIPMSNSELIDEIKQEIFYINYLSGQQMIVGNEDLATYNDVVKRLTYLAQHLSSNSNQNKQVA